MQLKKEFITYETGDEYILVSVDNQVFSGIVHFNKTSAFIVECLKKDTTEKKIIDAVLAKYDVERKIATKDVRNVIKQLKSIGAINE